MRIPAIGTSVKARLLRLPDQQAFQLFAGQGASEREVIVDVFSRERAVTPRRRSFDRIRRHPSAPKGQSLGSPSIHLPEFFAALPSDAGPSTAPEARKFLNKYTPRPSP